MRIVADIIAYTAKEMPKFNSISISGYHMQEAGATLAQELAYTLADGTEYVRAAIVARPRCRRLRRPAILLLRHRHELLHGSRETARRAPAVVAIMTDFGAEIRSLKDAAHALPDLGRVADRSRIPTTTSCAPPTRRWRRCSAARSRCIPTPSTKPSRCRPNFSARIARNTQLILQHETGVTQVVDPLGGSYYVETLTKELADRAWELIDEVEALGGMTKAVGEGLPKAADRGGGGTASRRGSTEARK